MDTTTITLSTNEKLGLISNFSTMFSAGIPILEIIDSLMEDAKGNQKKLLTVLKEDFTQGHQIHTTFAKFPRIFDKVTVSIIKASEEAGTLDVTFKDVHDNIQKEMEFSDKVFTAFLYPAFIVVVFFIVFIIILVSVVPKIATVFERLKVELPLPTKILIFTSRLLTEYTIPFLGGLLVFSVLTVILYKSNRKLILEILFSLPLISTIVKQIDLTRFARSLHLLLYSGIPLAYALELTQDVVIKKETARIIKRSKDLIVGGKTFTEGFKVEKGYIPVIMIKLLEAGEKSGSLDKTMDYISAYFDYQVTKTLKTMTSLLEPMLLVFVGLVVGGMMLAIIAPIYGLIGQVGNR